MIQALGHCDEVVATGVQVLVTAQLTDTAIWAEHHMPAVTVVEPV